MNDDRLVEIETKLAHQEQLLIELNDALANQQDSIMALERLCASITERLQSLGDGEASSPPDDERPPHY
jgi:SlyX protein